MRLPYPFLNMSFIFTEERIMPCCKSDQKSTANDPEAAIAATPETVKAASENEAAKASRQERCEGKSQHSKQRECGCC
jgi:hypothetical protein